MSKLLPLGLQYFRVDEVIECLPLGVPYHWTSSSSKAQRAIVEAELLELMPDAYRASAVDPPPEVREFPEPDAEPDRKLSVIWERLKPETQEIIIAAAVQEGHSSPRPATYRAS